MSGDGEERDKQGRGGKRQFKKLKELTCILKENGSCGISSTQLECREKTKILPKDTSEI